METNFTTTKIAAGTEYTISVNNKRQVVKTTADTVLLKDVTGAIVGVFNTEEEAQQAMPIIGYNLQRQYVPTRLHKVRPAHRQTNTQPTNKNTNNRGR